MRLKLRISRRDRTYVAAFTVMMTIVYSGIAYALLTPPRPAPFFALGTLGAHGLAADYYPNGNPNLVVGEQIKWTLEVYNHMGSIQYAVLKVKLINSTIPTPNSTTGTPSPSAPILEFDRVLLDNETWLIPFTWKILNLERVRNAVSVTRLLVNNSTFTEEISSAIHGANLRFVFELWFYDEAKQELTFSWVSNGGTHSAWTEIWFNATMAG